MKINIILYVAIILYFSLMKAFYFILTLRKNSHEIRYQKTLLFSRMAYPRLSSDQQPVRSPLTLYLPKASFRHFSEHSLR